jgi:hypothetical protein
MLTGDLQGVWWLPGSPEHLAPGTLTLSYDTRPTLVVVGSIDPNLDLPAGIGTVLGQTRDLPFVHGRTAIGQRVTLADTQLGVRQMHIADAESAVFELVGRAAYVGAHMDPKTAQFAQMDVVIERLIDWRDVTPFDLTVTPDTRTPKRIVIGGELPALVSARIDGGDLIIKAGLATSGDFRQHASLSLNAAVRIRVDQGLRFSDWLEVYVGPLERLVALATGRAVEVERLELSDPNADEKCEVIWPHKLRAALPERRLMPDELLFTVPDLGEKLSQHMSLWLAACRRFEPVMNMFFATRYAESMFEEDRFQNLIQAVEAYHRRKAGARPDQEAHDERSAALLAVAPDAYREWLAEVLETTREYRLSDRVEEVVEQHPWMRDDVIPGNAHRWAVRVAMARNYRAHQDPTSAPIGASAHELFGFTQRLTVLLEACLLHEVGFEEDRVREMIRRASPAYRILKLNPSL